MKCDICGIEIDSIKDAINANWIPSFYEKNQEHGPACPSCSELMLRPGDDGYLELKPEYNGKIEYAGDFYEKAEDENILIGLLIQDDNDLKVH